MQEDLDRQRKPIVKQCSKREEQIEHVMGATVRMYGNLQGIAGKSPQEISGLGMATFAIDFKPPSELNIPCSNMVRAGR